MSATQSAYGCRPVNSMVGDVRPRAVFSGIANSYATALYSGTPIIWQTGSAGGNIQIAANAADWVGAFAGVQYTDSNGRTQYSKYWPASLAALTAASIIAYIWDHPDIMYEMQTDATLTQANGIGQQFSFSSTTGFTVGAGNTTTQQSTCALNASNVGTGVQGMFRVEDLGREVDNAWGDLFVNVIGQVARHQYTSNKVAI
jgi:hypothetical protein